MALERLSNKLALTVLGLVFGLVLLAPGQARAQTGGWNLCNETSFVLEAATGRAEGSAVIVEGWTRLRPGECRTAASAPLPAGPSFVFARSSSAHRGGLRVWSGEIPLCVDVSGSFSVESPHSCTAMGLESRAFRAVKIDNRNSWTTRFLETEPYGRKRSETAGLQRLINDAGVATVSIDGFIGRRTRGSIARFLRANNLRANTSDSELIDILEEVARNRQRDVGMSMCNRTANMMWAAIGRRRGDGWESRGWWPIEAGTCARAIDDSLIATPHYIYAEMETPQGVRTLAEAEAIFCIARSKFAVIGRENCEVRAYREADFLETEKPEDGKLIVEFFERDFAPVEGLDG